MNIVLPGIVTLLVAALATILACIPGLHIYNVLGALLWLYLSFPIMEIPSQWIVSIILAMTSAWSIANTIPAIILAAPDESALLTVLPGQKMLLAGKGREAVQLTALGSLAALLVIAVSMPFLPRILPIVYATTQPHTHWILWSIILFMLLSEWPKAIPPGRSPTMRFLLANKTPAIGVIVFLLSGLLGFILFFRSPLPYANAFQNLMPAFVGLFTLPWLLYNAYTALTPPRQQPLETCQKIPERHNVRQGALAGILGGGFASFFPVVTGGIGGMLAGHATALRNQEAFLVSQGASKSMYYAGGILLFFVPELHLTRGGGAWMLQSMVATGRPHLYWIAGGSILLGGAVALLMLHICTNQMLVLVHKTGYRSLSIIAASIVVAIVALFSGWAGMAVMIVATAIGLLPLLYGTRRMNGLGVILLPIACSMSGLAPAITRFLGL